MVEKNGVMDDAFPVVVVAGLAIFGMFWIGSQAGGDFFSGITEKKPESTLLYSSDPGKIGSSNQDFRTIHFSSFTVGEIRGSVQAFTSEKETISNSLLGGNRIVVNYNATQPGSGQVSFEVLGRKSKGQIFVNVNGVQTFKAATISGATPEINISSENLHPGMNKIVIGTTQPGILGKASYTLEDIEVTVKDRKFHDYTTYFQLYDYELSNFRPSNLTFQVPLDASTPQKPLKIEINGKTVFNQRIGRSIQEVTVTPQNADLSVGYNTINFGTEGQAKYHIENPELQVRYSVNVEPAQTRMNFKLTEDRLQYVKGSDTQETLTFNYQKTTTSPPIKIQLNNAYYTINPENGLNQLKLEEKIFQKQNTLTLDSNQTFTAENLQIISEKVE